MKILYIIHANVVGGSNKALFNIIDYMKTRHDVRIVFPTIQRGEKTIIKDYLEANGIRYYCPCYYDAFVYGTDKNIIRRFVRTIGRLFRHLRIRKKIETIIDDFQPDIVHTNNGIIDIALDYCLKKKIPHIWHLREYQDLDFKMSIMPSKKIWLNRIHKQGNFNIAITKGIFDYFNLRSCDTYIYDGVIDLNEKYLTEENKQNYFLFVAGGVFNPGKGLLDTLKAYCIFSKKYSKCLLYIVGAIINNSYKTECDKFIQENNLENQIKFLGIRNDVNILMSRAKAILVSSDFEGFGFITAEAMYNDCLVIGRNKAGTKEQFDNGKEYTGQEIGLRFSNIEEMSKCMEKALNEDCSKLRKRARKVVEALYTKETSCAQLDKFYSKILNQYYCR